MPEAGGTNGAVLRSIGEIALNALQRPREETRMTLLPDDSPTPPRALRANEEYIRVRLMAAHLPYTRRFLTSYQPLVYAGVGLGETADETAEFAKVVSSGRSAEGLTGADRATLSEVTLLEASPYIGAFSLAVGLLSVRSSERARKLLERIAELSATAAAPLMGDAAKAVGALARSVDLLTLDGSFVEVGLMTSKPSPMTGVYALYADRGQEDEEIKFGFRDGRLVNAATTRPLRRPYIVISIEAVDRRPDAAKIPRVRKAMDRVLDLIDGGAYSEDAVRDMMKHYAGAVALCPDLLPVDRDHLIEAANKTFNQFRKARAQFDTEQKLESAPNAPEASALPRPARPKVEDVVADALKARFGDAQARPTTATRQNNLPDAVRQLQKAVRDGDLAGLGECTRACLEAVRSDQPPLDPGLVRDVLLSLRRVRRFGDMRQMAEALAAAGVKRPLYMRLHAQALIELGEAAAAEAVLTQAEALARKSGDDTERAEIFGLLGRIQKDRFVALKDGKDRRARQDALDRAIDCYRRGERISNNPSDFYHAVNWMALAHAGRKAGLRVAQAGKIKSIARRIMIYVDQRYPNTQPWDAANAAEASLAVGDHAGAEKWLDRYVGVAHGDGFALNSTLRQITSLWGIGLDHRLGGIVKPLQLAAMGADNGAARLGHAQARELLNKPPGKDRLEALFAGEAGMAVQRAYRALGLARFVGKVLHGEHTPLGTGFLVKAADLLPGGAAAVDAKKALLHLNDIDGDWLFLTNAHVVSPFGEGRSIPPEEVVVDFQMVDGPRRFRVRRLVWSSPIAAHDCTVLQLESYPAFADGAAPVMAAHLPQCVPEDADPEVKKARPRVLVLGHPAGRELEITFDNNLLIDHNGPRPGQAYTAAPVKVHYRAPTEGGSSGSPVFNARTLELIAIHHMGSVAPLNPATPASGYQANEGLSLRAISHAFEAHLRQAKTAIVPAAAPAAPAAAAPVATGATFELLRGYADWEAGPAYEGMLEASARRLPDVCANFIASFEISSPAYYRKALQAPVWPGGASGLTIGVGYDLRHATPAEFRDTWKAYLPPATLERLVTYCNLAEPDDARRKLAVEALKDIAVPLEAALAVFRDVMMPQYTQRTEACFLNTGALNDISMGALVSLVFNRGASLGPDDKRKEMRNIAAHMQARNFDAIPAEIRAMKRIWEGKPKLRGLLVRRDKEAAFFEEGLKQVAKVA